MVNKCRTPTHFLDLPAVCNTMSKMSRPFSSLLRDGPRRTALGRVVGGLLVSFCLSACIVCDGTEKLWGSGDVDQGILGAWVVEPGGTTVALNVRSDAGDMLCDVSIPAVLGSTTSNLLFKCRSVRSNHGLSFLVIPHGYSMLPRFLGDHEQLAAVGGSLKSLSLLVPYRIEGSNSISLFTPKLEELREEITRGELPGGLLLNEDEPESRSHYVPVLYEVTLNVLNMVSSGNVNTNETFMIVHRAQTQ